MYKLPILILAMFPAFIYGQYFKLGIFDNSVKGQHPSTLGFAYEFGLYSDYGWAKIDYGMRVEKGHFGPGENRIPADYISFVVLPKFYVDDFQEEIKLIVGAGLRFGGAANKLAASTYLQNWYVLNVGIGFGDAFELCFSFERSTRDAIYKTEGSQDIGFLSVLLRM